MDSTRAELLAVLLNHIFEKNLITQSTYQQAMDRIFAFLDEDSIDFYLIPPQESKGGEFSGHSENSRGNDHGANYL